MEVFTFYFNDRRYTAPTLEFVTVRDEARARELAQQRLGHSENYLSAEVFLDDVRLFTITRETEGASEHATPGKGSVVERAFELARTGEYPAVGAIKDQLRREGFHDARARVWADGALPRLDSELAARATKYLLS